MVSNTIPQHEKIARCPKIQVRTCCGREHKLCVLLSNHVLIRTPRDLFLSNHNRDPTVLTGQLSRIHTVINTRYSSDKKITSFSTFCHFAQWLRVNGNNNNRGTHANKL